jgi:hypothetical protein
MDNMDNLVKISQKLYDSIEGDYGMIRSDGLYEEDIRNSRLSNDVTDNMISWYYSVLPIFKAYERDRKINNILDNNNNIDKVIDDKARLDERISIGLERELKRQKEAGKKFISDEEIDNLIDSIIKEELK